MARVIDHHEPSAEELMARVRTLRIVAERAVSELFAGEYSSAFRGRGMEFSEVREYEPGDDVRAIDWNVTARAGRPFIKRFQEERELTVMLALDMSASLAFGSADRLKQRVAAELCAMLALAATRSNDRVGLLVFGGEDEVHLPARKGPNHALRVMREVLGFRARGRSESMSGALEELRRTLRRRAVVFLISDFLTDLSHEGFVAPLSLLRRRHDVTAISVGDRRERELPRSGMFELEDAETGRRAVVDASSARVRRAFERRAAERDRALDAALARARVDRLRIEAGEDYAHALMRHFRMRERRR